MEIESIVRFLIVRKVIEICVENLGTIVINHTGFAFENNYQQAYRAFKFGDIDFDGSVRFKTYKTRHSIVIRMVDTDIELKFLRLPETDDKATLDVKFVTCDYEYEYNYNLASDSDEYEYLDIGPDLMSDISSDSELEDFDVVSDSELKLRKRRIVLSDSDSDYEPEPRAKRQKQ